MLKINLTLEYMERKKLFLNISHLLSLMLCGSALTVNIHRLVMRIQIIDMTNYQVYACEQSFPAWSFIGGTFIPLLLLLGFIRENFTVRSARISKVFMPLLLLWPLNVFCPFKYFSILFSILIIGVVVFRLKCAWNIPLKFRCRISGWLAVLMVMMFYSVAVAWSFYIQSKAYHSFFLLFGDWGQYARSYLNLAFGSSVTFWNYLTSAGHWNPAINLIMSGMIKLFPSAKTIFMINSLLIYSVIPLCYILSRVKHLPRSVSLIFSLIVCFNPVISNQCLSLFYGFHPINFIIPTLLLFFIFSVRKNRCGMIIFFIFSILIQETVLAFWAGYGLWLMIRRQWMKGVGLFLFSVFMFTIISHWILPHSFASGQYTQMFHYKNLGDTPLDVVLSPFLRPLAFYHAVFQFNNFAFIMTLILPLFILLLSYPVPLIVILPLLAGVCLQGSPEVKTVVLQYGLEITVFMFALAIYNAKKILSGKKTLLVQILNWGCGRDISSKVFFQSSLCTTLFLVMTTYYFLGLTPIAGKYNSVKITSRPDFTKTFNYIKQFIPAGSRVITSNELQTHFMFDYQTLPWAHKLETDDVIVLDLHHSFDQKADLEKLRAMLAANARVHPITSINWYYKQIVVFKVSPPEIPQSKLPFMTFLTHGQLAASGTLLPLSDTNFSAAGRADGKNTVILFRLNRKIDYDVDFHININGVKYLTSFGRGLVPAYSMDEGATFIFELPIPVVENINVQIIRRPESKPLQAFE